MTQMLTRRRAVALATASFAAPHVARAQAATKLTFGSVGQAADIGIFAAIRRGWFKAEGIDLEMVNFASAANMVAPLGAGQLDVGGGSASAGLYNAWLRGIRLKIVADKASSQPGYAVNRIAVAKRHIESGRYKAWSDLKGMKIAMNGTGISSWGTLAAGLKRGGLTFADVTTVDMPFPDHVLALQNGAVDGSLTTEPSITIAIQRGYAVALAGDDELIPRHAISQLLYPEDFVKKKPELALKFMRAYLKGVRLYNDALRDGRLGGPASDEVIAMLTDYTPIKDPAIYRSIIPVGMDPNGKVDMPSLKSDYELYKSLGLVQGDVKVEDVVDMSFADAAVKELGPYRRQ